MVSVYRSRLLTKDFPDLPSDLDMQWVERYKKKIELELYHKFAKKQTRITKLKELLDEFKDGTIDPKLNCGEIRWAAKLVLFELEINGKKD